MISIEPRYTSGNKLEAPYLLVGEAPGAEEVLANEAFVGDAGQLLTRMAHRAGIPRSEFYMRNVFDFRPLNNNIKPYLDLDKVSKALQSMKLYSATQVAQVSDLDVMISHLLTEEYKDAKDRLRLDLESCPQKIIIAAGGIPLWTLCNKLSSYRWRGSLLRSTLVPSKYVLPIIHPAAALPGRDYSAQTLIAIDLANVRRYHQAGITKPPESNIEMDLSCSDIIDRLDFCRSKEMVAFDIEVIGQHLSCFSIAHSTKDAFCVPIMDFNQSYFPVDQEAEVLLALERLFNSSTHIIGQNIAFDAHFMYTTYGMIIHNLEDTMVAQAMILPDYPKGLDFLTSIYCDGEPYYKQEGKIWFKWGGDWQSFLRYNALDSLCTLRSWIRQQEDMKGSLMDAYVRQRDLIHPLIYMQHRGIKCKKEVLSGYSSQLSASVKDLQIELDALVKVHPGFECGLNVNSPKQVSNYLYGALGLRTYISRKTGKITTDDDALKRLSRQGCKEAMIIRKIRMIRKAVSTYFEVELDADSRLRCSYNPVGTRSGRLSSSKTIWGTGLNMQNLIKERSSEDAELTIPDIRTALFADDGYLGFRMDLSQAENRIVAFVSGDGKMMKAFNDKQDVHKLTASLIHNVELANVTKEQRDVGKKCNHAFNYDMGYKQFALLCEMPETKARFYLEAYHDAYPSVRQWHTRVVDQLKQNKTLVDLFGKPQTFLSIWGHDLFKQAYSYIPQSTVATKLNTHGLLHVWHMPGLDVEPLNVVHDDLWFQIPVSIGFPLMAEYIMSIKQSLEQPLFYHERSFIIPADLQIGVCFGDMEELKSNEYTDVTELARRLSEIYGKHRA